MLVKKRIMVFSLVPIGARASTKKHSALEIIQSSKFFSSTFERSLFHDPLDTLALKGLRFAIATHAQP